MLLSGIKSTTAAANISQLVGIYENVVVVITNVSIVVGFRLRSQRLLIPIAIRFT